MTESKISASGIPVRKLTVTAVLMAMNIIMSTSVLSVPVPGGHMYLNDVIIVTAAVLLEPFYAFLVGGVGAFIGDMLFYPTPMFVSLAVHGLQAVLISLFVHRWMKDRPVPASIVGAARSHLCIIVVTITSASIEINLSDHVRAKIAKASGYFSFRRRSSVPMSHNVQATPPMASTPSSNRTTDSVMAGLPRCARSGVGAGSVPERTPRSLVPRALIAGRRDCFVISGAARLRRPAG